MTETIARPRAATAPSTRALLACGAAAGPLFLVVAAIQVVTRDGFDITRHAVSLLSNGDLGWIQITNFEATGLLTVLGAVGMRRALRGGRGAKWGPLLLGGYGLSLVAAGIFRADPALGFPPGTPADATAVSWHGVLHFVAGGIGFLSLIAACFVFASRYAALGRSGWAWYSRATGVVFFVAFAGIASGSRVPGLNVAFALAVVVAWTWVTATAIRLARTSEGANR
jgi:hypothetical protein